MSKCFKVSFSPRAKLSVWPLRKLRLSLVSMRPTATCPIQTSESRESREAWLQCHAVPSTASSWPRPPQRLQLGLQLVSACSDRCWIRHTPTLSWLVRPKGKQVGAGLTFLWNVWRLYLGPGRMLFSCRQIGWTVGFLLRHRNCYLWIRSG